MLTVLAVGLPLLQLVCVDCDSVYGATDLSILLLHSCCRVLTASIAMYYLC
jgi:hypothetical protein